MGLTLKKKCKERCDVSRQRHPCTHPKVSESYYVEFRVLDDGHTLTLDPSGQIKRWKVGSLNKTAAKQQEALIRSRLMTGKMPSPSIVRADSMTFRQWAEQYLGLEAIRRLKSYPSRQFYVANLVKFFQDAPLGSITSDDVRRYREQRIGYTGKPVSVQTINHDHMTLIHMFNVARSPQFRLVTDNPAEHVPKPNPQNDRDRIATPGEWERILQTAAPHLRRLLTVAYYLGPRKGELVTLEWADVDLHRKEFTLRRTKNDESRLIPMTPLVYEIFQELQRERRKGVSRVFLYRGRPFKRIGTAFKAACRRAGVTNLRVHDFRHTASTNLRRAGVDTATAMKIVGHKSDRMHRRYNTIEPEDLHDAASKLAVFSNTLITPKGSTERVKHVS